MQEMTIQEVLSDLERVKSMGHNQWQACCPSHDDREPSLSISIGETGKILFHCHAGCTFEQITSSLGLSEAKRQGRVRRKRERRKSDVPAPIDWNELFHRYTANLSFGDMPCEELGISKDSLARLEIGWDGEAFTFPMFNAERSPVGIRRRFPDGTKKAVTGSKAGLFWPLEPDDDNGNWNLFIVEGPTDAGAMLDLGFDVIGRPSCSGGTEIIKKVLKTLNLSQVIIVADQDTPKTHQDGSQWFPGWEGALALMDGIESLTACVKIIEPPPGFKDVREWKQAKQISQGTILELCQATRIRRGC